VRQSSSLAESLSVETLPTARPMTVWGRWVRRPQSLWLRKALFQIHLWTGIGVGLYIFVVSVTGSVLVFRVELSNAFEPQPVFVTNAGTPLAEAALKEAAERAHPGYRVSQVFMNQKNPNRAVEVWLERDGSRTGFLFNPYTAQDLGPAVPLGYRTVTWLLDLHDNLLAGQTGRLANGIGGFFLVCLCLTGAIIWWPGIRNWRRSLFLRWNVNWKRLTWDLHNAVGFWTFILVFMWGLTGFYLVFQAEFAAIVDYFQPYPPDEQLFALRFGDRVLVWFGRLHFGRYYGMPMKVLWFVLGLAPPVLFVTGALMWWNRVLRHGIRLSNEGT
jgi:uncharacterized iron-regulated membrane protein